MPKATVERFNKGRLFQRTLPVTFVNGYRFKKIFFDDQIINQQNLTIPHPRMQERAFVFVPLAEIAPNWIDPRSGKSVSTLCKRVDCNHIVKIKAFETTSN